MRNYEKLCLLDHQDSKLIKQRTMQQAITEANSTQDLKDGMIILEMNHFMMHSTLPPVDTDIAPHTIFFSNEGNPINGTQRTPTMVHTDISPY